MLGLSCVASLTDGSELRVLCPDRWRCKLSKAQRPAAKRSLKEGRSNARPHEHELEMSPPRPDERSGDRAGSGPTGEAGKTGAKGTPWQTRVPDLRTAKLAVATRREHTAPARH